LKIISVKISYVLISFTIILLILSIIMPTSITIARCPSGTHKSPSGDCEPVVPHAGLPRCPNGFHRSPSGDCEKVSSSSPESSVNSGSTNFDQNDNSIPAPSSPTPLSSPLPPSSATTSSNQCDQTLWKHIYNPTRLQVVDACKSVLGVIESKRVEKDGDYHIRVKLDPPFSNLINSANIKNQFGDLVVEPICVNRVTQADAISACQNFHQNISIPPIGSHVNITGSYVLDKEHGNWAEIHPVTSITTIP
jgi:hypothetical protein